MKHFARGLVVLGTALALFLGARPALATNTVQVCHRTEADTFVKLNIHIEALPAHLAHGDVYPVPTGGCVNITPTATSVPPTATPTNTEVPSATATATEAATGTATDAPSATPTGTLEPTPTETEDPCAEGRCEPSPTPTETPRCDPDPEPCGWNWHLVGPEGQTAWFVSFSLRPGGDPFKGSGWYPPNSRAQQKCLGWTSVGNLPGLPYYGDTPLVSCEGGECVQK